MKKVKQNAEQHAVKMEVVSRSVNDEQALFDEDDMEEDEIVLGRETDHEAPETSKQRLLSKAKVQPVFEALKTTSAGHKIQEIREMQTVPVCTFYVLRGGIYSYQVHRSSSPRTSPRVPRSSRSTASTPTLPRNKLPSRSFCPPLKALLPQHGCQCTIYNTSLCSSALPSANTRWVHLFRLRFHPLTQSYVLLVCANPSPL